MPTRDQTRGVAQRTEHAADPRTWSEFWTVDRVAEMLRESEQERLARLARHARRPGSERPMPPIIYAVRSTAASILGFVRRRSIVPRAGGSPGWVPSSGTFASAGRDGDNARPWGSL
jgi:hypothetical protein